MISNRSPPRPRPTFAFLRRDEFSLLAAFAGLELDEVLALRRAAALRSEQKSWLRHLDLGVSPEEKNTLKLASGTTNQRSKIKSAAASDNFNSRPDKIHTVTAINRHLLSKNCSRDGKLQKKNLLTNPTAANIRFRHGRNLRRC